MKNLILLPAVVTMITVLSGCDSNSLGDNIYLLEGDRKEDRIIVECTGKSFGDCKGGTYLIPRSYEEHFHDGKYSEFVDKVKSDDDYVIACTIGVNNDVKRYWVIDKKKKRSHGTDDNHSYVSGPFDYNSFLEERRKNNIKINF